MKKTWITAGLLVTAASAAAGLCLAHRKRNSKADRAQAIRKLKSRTKFRTI